MPVAGHREERRWTLNGSGPGEAEEDVLADSDEYIKRRRVLKNIVVRDEFERVLYVPPVMKLLAVLAVFAMLAYTSASTLPAVYDGPTYELSKHTSHRERSRINFLKFK